jgi:hypothetical protein
MPKVYESNMVTEAHMAGNGGTHATVSWRVIRYNPQVVYQKRSLTRSSGEGGPGLPGFLSLAQEDWRKLMDSLLLHCTLCVSLSTQVNTPKQRFLSTEKPGFKEMSALVQGLILGQFQAYGL